MSILFTVIFVFNEFLSSSDGKFGLMSEIRSFKKKSLHKTNKIQNDSGDSDDEKDRPKNPSAHNIPLKYEQLFSNHLDPSDVDGTYPTYKLQVN